MATRPDDLLPKASDFMKKLALAEAEEASKQAHKMAEAEAEKKALVDHVRKPSGVSDEEGIRRAVKIIERAVSNGLTEVARPSRLASFARSRKSRGFAAVVR